MDCKIKVDMLGACRLTIRYKDFDRMVEFPGRKTWMLFEYLYLHSERCMSMNEIKEALWADQELASPLNSVKVLVYELRRGLDHEVPGLGKKIIRYNYGSYYLSLDGIQFECDAELFEQDAIQAMNSNDVKAIKTARYRYTGFVQITDENSRWQHMLREKYHSYYKQLVLAEIELYLKEKNEVEALKTCAEANLLCPNEIVFMEKYQEIWGKNDGCT